MSNHIFAIGVLLSLSAFGFKSLHLFATSNGLLAHLEKCITNGTTPGGKPLRTITTNGRFPGVDLQLRAVAVFLLIFCEALDHGDADVVGFSFAANWGASWILIVLESLREYSRERFMNWITIPGILIFNQSNAVFTPLYLAIRLAFASSSNSAGSLMIAPTDLKAIPTSFLWGYVVPLFAMTLPGVMIRGINTKHAIASWYQQWNIYICLIHFALVWWRSDNGNFQNPHLWDGLKLLDDLRPVYIFTMWFAAVSLWVPVILSLVANLLPRASTKLNMGDIFLPPSPWSKVRCTSVFEGGKWLLQWDGIIGSLGSAVWAMALFNDARATQTPELSLVFWMVKTLRYLVLGGPMAVAAGLLWERDEMLLSGRDTSLM